MDLDGRFSIGGSMKKVIGADGRIIYKSGRSTACGGNVYIHKTIQGCVIENKLELRRRLIDISARFGLIDPTIKIYERIFFLLFHIPDSLVPQTLIDAVHQNIAGYGKWDEDYVYRGIYDAQEKYVREDLKEWGYDYDQG